MLKKALLLLINTLLICTLTLATPTHAGIGEKITAAKEWCKEKWEKTTWKQIAATSVGTVAVIATAYMLYKKYHTPLLQARNNTSTPSAKKRAAYIATLPVNSTYIVEEID